MERKLDNSPPTSLIEIVEIFGKNGEFHKDVSKLSDSIESLVITLGKNSGKNSGKNKEENTENTNPRTFADDWKDFTQELKRSLFDAPAQYLGMKKNVKKKENEDLKKEASKKGNIKENSVDAKDTSKIVDKDHSSTILSDMVDVLKLIREDKTHLKIYEDIVELKKIVKNLNDISAKTIEPNDDAAKEEDREKLAEAIARRLADVIGDGGIGGIDTGIPDKPGGKDKNKPKAPEKPVKVTPGKIAGAAGALAIAGEIATVALVAQAADELAGMLGVNKENGKKLGVYPQELDDIQEKQLKILGGFYSKVGAFARAQETVHGVLGLDETQQAERRQRVEKEFVLINEGIKNLDKNKDLTTEEKKSLLELEAKRQALIPKKAPPEVKPAPPQANKETSILEAEKSSSAVNPAETSKIEAPASVSKSAQIGVGNEYGGPTADISSAVSSAISPSSIAEYTPDKMATKSTNPRIEVNKSTMVSAKDLDKFQNADILAKLRADTFDDYSYPAMDFQKAPVVMSSNKTINNNETVSMGEKITPYPTYATFDRWQDKRSWGYDHV